MLVASGCHVQEAHSAEQALKYMNQLPADVVILDVKLTTMNSSAWRNIRTKSDAALIAIGVRGSEQEEVAALNAGAVKPFRLTTARNVFSCRKSSIFYLPNMKLDSGGSARGTLLD